MRISPLYLLAGLPAVTAVAPLVDLGYSKYRGSDNGNGISQWLGLRFAAPPTGDLRFRRPADPISTGDIIQVADKHGKICLSTGAEANNATFSKQSEDCLFLDVYAPSSATPNSKLPVFFFIQGGGFNSDSNPNLNGSGLIEAGDKSLIVVTFNYRVGPYGFITNGKQIATNNGLYDQVKALEWVQKHIAKFGGDPKHVVIGGDSAGAASVSLHLIRDGGQDHKLFVGGAAESVSFSTTLTVDENQYLYDGFAVRAGCAVTNSLSCLRSKTTAELQAANNNAQSFPGGANPPLYAWGPVIDGEFLRELPYVAFQKGKFVRVPIMMGDDTNGGTVFAPKTATTIPQVNGFLRDQFSFLTLSDLETIDNMYPNPNKTCPNVGCRWRQVSNAYGDMRYTCPGLKINELFATYGVSKSWAYLWNVEDPDQIKQGLGVPHTVELNAIFGPENVNGGAPKSYYPGGVNAHAVTVVQGYWTSFIRTLSPNTHRAEGAAEWETYSSGHKHRLVFGTGGTTAMEALTSTLDRACRFFTSIGPRIRQ